MEFGYSVKPSNLAWIDFENTPHVLFLRPIATRLAECGCDPLITAKPQSQTMELANLYDLDVHAIGGGNLTSRTDKVLGGIRRAIALTSFIRGRGGARVLVSSSRTASLAARCLNVPAIGIMDYEHSTHWPLSLGCRMIWLPDLLRASRLPALTRRKARYFPGLKENLYLDVWSGDRSSARSELGAASSEMLVVARPPAESAHYASDRSMIMWQKALASVGRGPAARILVAARDRPQAASLQARLAGIGGVTVLQTAMAGPTLVDAADLIIGGGGTMNREAAVLGVPVWSTFCGPSPHIDECLAREGRLTWVREEGDLRSALRSYVPARKPRRGPFPEALELIADSVLSFASRDVRPVYGEGGASWASRS